MSKLLGLRCEAASLPLHVPDPVNVPEGGRCVSRSKVCAVVLSAAEPGGYKLESQDVGLSLRQRAV